MNYVSKKHLSRRALLRGAGVAIALPFLDAMVPAQAAIARTAARAPLRVGFCFIPHGALIANWTPASHGADWELSRNLAPLRNVKDQVVVLTGLNLGSAASHGGTPPAFLSGTACRRTEGDDVRAATTLDQILARRIGAETMLRSLEIGTEDSSGLRSAFDLIGYRKTYIETISWKSPTEPLPVEINPQAVFDRLFRNGSGMEHTRRILDEISDEMKSLQMDLGAHDRNRLAEYLDDVHEIERRIQIARIPDDHVEHTRLMFDLMALAYQADITRIQTFMMAREVSYRSFPHIGVSEGFHTLSHHQYDPVKEDHLINVNTYHVSQMARFLERLKSIPDGEGTLLDHSILLYGSGMGLANSHQHNDLPVFIAGGANGQLNGNRHLKFSGEPLANLLLSISGRAGVHLRHLGDSTGPLKGL